MRPSQIVIGMVLFVGCLTLFGVWVGSFTDSETYDIAMNESKYNKTFGRFNTTKADLIGDQEKLANDTLREEDFGTFTTDNVFTSSVQALSGIWKSGAVMKDLMTDMQDSMNLPYPVFNVIVTLVIAVLVFGILTIFLKQKV